MKFDLKLPVELDDIVKLSIFVHNQQHWYGNICLLMIKSDDKAVVMETLINFTFVLIDTVSSQCHYFKIENCSLYIFILINPLYNYIGIEIQCTCHIKILEFQIRSIFYLEMKKFPPISLHVHVLFRHNNFISLLCKMFCRN